MNWFGFSFSSDFQFTMFKDWKKKRRHEELRAMHSRKKMVLLPVINTHNVAGTTGGNDGMALFDLASKALIKFCVMH